MSEKEVWKETINWSNKSKHPNSEINSRYKSKFLENIQALREKVKF